MQKMTFQSEFNLNPTLNTLHVGYDNGYGDIIDHYLHNSYLTEFWVSLGDHEGAGESCLYCHPMYKAVDYLHNVFMHVSGPGSD